MQKGARFLQNCHSEFVKATAETLVLKVLSYSFIFYCAKLTWN
jgi:hypothetical protein